MIPHCTLLTKLAYHDGWTAYRSALYLSDSEVQCLTEGAENRGAAYFNEWLKGWQDAAEADKTLMD